MVQCDWVKHPDFGFVFCLEVIDFGKKGKGHWNGANPANPANPGTHSGQWRTQGSGQDQGNQCWASGEELAGHGEPQM